MRRRRAQTAPSRLPKSGAHFSRKALAGASQTSDAVQEQAPADDAAREQVDDDGQIHPALPSPEIRDVADPGSVRSVRAEAPVEPSLRPPKPRPWRGPTTPLPTPAGFWLVSSLRCRNCPGQVAICRLRGGVHQSDAAQSRPLAHRRPRSRPPRRSRRSWRRPPCSRCRRLVKRASTTCSAARHSRMNSTRRLRARALLSVLVSRGRSGP
jgi:hypothetical protein